jgi:hypothetical protein
MHRQLVGAATSGPPGPETVPMLLTMRKGPTNDRHASARADPAGPREIFVITPDRVRAFMGRG